MAFGVTWFGRTECDKTGYQHHLIIDHIVIYRIVLSALNSET